MGGRSFVITCGVIGTLYSILHGLRRVCSCPKHSVQPNITPNIEPLQILV